MASVDRALGLLMAHRLAQKRGEYAFDFKHCDCPDATIRKHLCKHSLALMLKRRHDEILEEFRHG